MAKFKAAGRKKAAPATTRAQAVGCVFILLMAFGLVFLVIFLAIRQG
jgi:hypothetical protein